MPYQSHLKVTFSGVVGDTATAVDDVWVSSVNMARDGLPSSSGDLVYLKGLADEYRAAWVTHLLPKQTNGHKLTRVRVASIGTDGRVNRTASGAYAQADNDTSSQGTATTGRMPPQIALAISLESAYAGPLGRGRFFLAGASCDLDAGGTLAATAHAAWRDAALAFVNAMNAAEAAALEPIRVVVASGGSIVKGVKEVNREVVNVRVGQTLDTQRRRRNAIPENYLEGAVTA